MAYENLCMYCFQDLGGESICPHCGKDSRAAVPQIQMLPGTPVYRDRFLVGRALGQDAGGIVYAAMDTKRGGVIRIREYLPRNCAERLNDGSVVPIAGMEDAFEAGMKKLRASVESVDDPKKRHFYFEENGTAYIAQRKNASGSGAAASEDVDDEYESDRRKQIIMYVAIAAAVVLVVAIGLIWFLNSMSEPSDVTLDNPLSTTSAGATWQPAVTPTPTPYATATFAALVDPELSWMDYTYKGNGDAAQTAAPTKKPTVDTGTNYPTVNDSSNANSVRSLQNRLVELGWLSGASGKYDSATRQAVKDFQNYVNENCSPAKKLAVDGIAGEKTQQWLFNASVSLVRPTPTPKPPVTAAPDDGTVKKGSPAKEVRAVQNKLIDLGLLPEGSADGKYGSTTAAAVKNFQIRVNQLQGYQALNITGEVDPQTMAYLNYYVEWWAEQHPSTATATPKPPVTATPSPKPQPTDPTDGAIKPSSGKQEITAVQELLEKVGLLSADDVDGVYGGGTIAAVKHFQNWVNQQRGDNTLNVTGYVDALTLSYLQYCVDNNRPVVTPTARPTDVPTPEPTEVPPEQQPGDDGVGPASPVESITFVQEMLADVGLMDASKIDGVYGNATSEAIRALQRFVNEQKGETILEVNGVCNRATLEYLQYCYDHGWNLSDQGDAPEPTDTPPAQDDANSGITPSSSREVISSMQEMLADVGLIDASDVDGVYGNATSEAIRALQRFVNEQKGETILEVSGACDALTMKYLKYCYEQGWNLSDQGDAPDDGPTQAPDEPVQEPDPTASIADVSGFALRVNGREADGLLELDSGKYELSWGADGGVQSYFVYLYDGGHALVNSAEDSNLTSFKLDTSKLNAGEVYELRVGALPVGGDEDDILWRSLQMTLAEAATPEPTEVPTAKPSVDAPKINIGSSVYQSDGVTYINDSTVIFSWMAGGDVESYTVNLEYQDGSEYSLGTTNDTSKTVKRDQLQPGLYKLHVGANPIGGGETVWSELLFGVPAPEATEAPEPDPTQATSAGDQRIEYLDAMSDPADIQTVQMALYRYGLLNTDGVEPGVLDATTLEAIAQFQMKVNETFGAELTVIDPESTVSIDSATLDYLLYQQLAVE